MAILDFDAARNKYAVYTGSQDDAPLVNPLGNLSRVKWHADLQYIGITDTVSLTTNVNPKNFASEGYTFWEKPLFSHGKSFRPLVLGVAWINGYPVPTNGNILMNFGAAKILFSVVATTTQVVFKVNQRLTPPGNPLPNGNVNIAFDFYVCNVGLTAAGSPVLPSTFQGVEATPTRFRCGQFDSLDKHLSFSSAGNVSFYQGHSISVQALANGLALRQSVNGLTVDFNGPYQAFNASVVRANVT